MLPDHDVYSDRMNRMLSVVELPESHVNDDNWCTAARGVARTTAISTRMAAVGDIITTVLGVVVDNLRSF